MKNRCSIGSTIVGGLVVLFTLASWTPSACADLLALKSGEKIYGLVDEVSEDRIRFRAVPTASANSPTGVRTWSRSEVKVLVRNFDPERLKGLTLEKLSGYQRYAEELLPQIQDPVAHELCLQLVLIVGHHADEGSSLRSWAIQCLQPLARSADERLRFQALKALYDRHDKPTTSKDTAEIEARNIVEMQQLLQAIRTGDQTLANSKIRYFETTGYPAVWEPELSLGELKRMSKKKQLTPRELLKVVELGLVLSGTSTEISNRAEDWAGLSQKAYRGWDKFPRFDNITEFNPRLSSFVDGKWVRPTPVQN